MPFFAAKTNVLQPAWQCRTGEKSCALAIDSCSGHGSEMRPKEVAAQSPQQHAWHTSVKLRVLKEGLFMPLRMGWPFEQF